MPRFDGNATAAACLSMATALVLGASSSNGGKVSLWSVNEEMPPVVAMRWKLRFRDERRALVVKMLRWLLETGIRSARLIGMYLFLLSEITYSFIF